MCKKDNPNYNKSNVYLKLIVKNGNNLSEEKHYPNHFHKDMSQKNIVQYLINTNQALKATYECYQDLINSLKEKDFKNFKAITLNQNKNLSSKIKQALRFYKENIKYIENSFKYDINNEIIEALTI